MEVVINSYYGGFAISKECAEYMAKLGNKKAIAELKFFKNRKNKKDTWEDLYGRGLTKTDIEGYDRTDKDLIKAIKELGKKANNRYAKLKIVEIPDNIDYYIYEDEGGWECIHEDHRTWD